jgi:hypothetical protein
MKMNDMTRRIVVGSLFAAGALVLSTYALLVDDYLTKKDV